MIDAGVHDADLRATHDEFVEYGRDRIARAIRLGIEVGELRGDIDPAVAAELLHAVLIFYESLLVAGTTTRERAQQVARLALTLLGKPNQPQPVVGANGQRGTDNAKHSFISALGSPVEVLEASLMADPKLAPEAAQTLSRAFRPLY
jgi:hypothetical protein